MLVSHRAPGVVPILNRQWMAGDARLGEGIVEAANYAQNAMTTVADM